MLNNQENEYKKYSEKFWAEVDKSECTPLESDSENDIDTDSLTGKLEGFKLILDKFTSISRSY